MGVPMLHQRQRHFLHGNLANCSHLFKIPINHPTNKLVYLHRSPFTEVCFRNSDLYWRGMFYPSIHKVQWGCSYKTAIQEVTYAFKGILAVFFSPWVFFKFIGSDLLPYSTSTISPTNPSSLEPKFQSPNCTIWPELRPSLVPSPWMQGKLAKFPRSAAGGIVWNVLQSCNCSVIGGFF